MEPFSPLTQSKVTYNTDSSNTSSGTCGVIWHNLFYHFVNSHLSISTLSISTLSALTKWEDITWHSVFHISVLPDKVVQWMGGGCYPPNDSTWQLLCFAVERPWYSTGWATSLSLCTNVCRHEMLQPPQCTVRQSGEPTHLPLSHPFC